MGVMAFASMSVLIAMASSIHLAPRSVEYDVGNARPLFESFLKEYKRRYKDDADKELHYEAFVNNLKKINEMNKRLPNPVFGINNAADLTESEQNFRLEKLEKYLNEHGWTGHGAR